ALLYQEFVQLSVAMARFARDRASPFLPRTVKSKHELSGIGRWVAGESALLDDFEGATFGIPIHPSAASIGSFSGLRSNRFFSKQFNSSQNSCREQGYLAVAPFHFSAIHRGRHFGNSAEHHGYLDAVE